ncbi:biotin carboxyl carrier protein [Aurantiacibacter poecillastricola]|uniref:biotin carboxyl carrier protein n=1 Tax=Aurantiacibacter poecillastricola TaxID=3064385 RepID=UPI00273D9958|nr:biotin carboxyl carrier protein [Aurantiacibacter sp. 219JJ12-13]MDP5261408.1 biotin carboxyl carrier protein [Aurantiacibacter sp. 219JJ12-13]
MTNIQIVETSLRDGNQCLWGATGIDTAKTLSIAPVMERAGFSAIDFTTSTHMGVAVRYKQEDPWERIRGMADICGNTPLQFLSTGFRFIAWETATPDFMELAFATLARNGIRRFALADPMNDAKSNVEVARMVKRAGGEQVVGALVYSISPIHDDAHYAEAARTMAASKDIDALYIKDPGGLLTSKRAATLIPAIMAEIGDLPLELHSHSTIGLAEQAYCEAADMGIAALQCASGGLSSGTSHPSVKGTVANLRATGHTVDLDDEAVDEIADWFTAIADAENLPKGEPMHFDAAYFQHNLPGGMVGTMRRHLADQGVPELEGAVIEEMGRVRRELGWPIVMTPFAQMLQTQAVMNVTSEERWSVIPDEIIRFAIGKFGRPNAPVDPDVMDRIMANPRTKELEAEKGMTDVAELRKKLGTGLSDEEFLLRATMPQNLVDAMQAAGPAQREYDPRKVPLMNLLRDVLSRSDLDGLSLEKDDLSIEVQR